MLYEETRNLKGYMHRYVCCSIIHNSQDLEAAMCPLVGEWIKKAVVCLHNGILLGCKKEEILPLAAEWVDLGSIMLNEISQLEKDKYYMISLIYGI